MTYSDTTTHDSVIAREQLDFLFEKNPQPMWVYDIETFRFLAVNETAVNKYGYSREEFLRMTIENIRPAEDIPALRERLRTMTGDSDPNRTWRHSKKDGSIILVEITSRDVLFDGRKARFIMAHDVTARFMAQEALTFSEARFRQLVDTTAAAIFFYHDEHFGYANHAAERITGYSSEELRRMKFLELVHPDQRDIVRERATARLRGEDVPSRYEIKILTKNKETRWVDIAVGIIRLDGKPAVLGTAVDCTDAHRTEQALRLSEEKLRTLMDTTYAGIFFYSGDHFSFVNKAMERITGYTAQELLGRQIWDFIHSDHREMVQQRAEARQRGENVPARYELQIVHKDGTQRWLDLSISMTEIEGEQVLMGTIVDITQQHKAQDELRHSEERFRALYEHNPLMCFTVDLQGVVQYVNDAGAKQLGYTKEELIHQPVMSVLHQDDKPLLARNIMDSLASTAPTHSWELRKLHKSGKVLYVSETAQVIRDAKGNTSLLIVCEDVSSQHRTQQLLRESETKFRTLTETTSSAIFFFHEERFRYANRAMERITGYSSEELQRMRFIDLVHPEHLALARERSLAVLKGDNSSAESELKILTKNLDLRWLDVSLSRIDIGGETSVMATAVDITERKTFEEELRRSEELTMRILEAVPGGIMEVALDGTILQVNVQAQELLGLAALDLFRMNISGFADQFLAEDGSKLGYEDFPLVQCLNSGEEQEPATLGVRRPDGGISWMVVAAVPLTDIATGKTSGAVLTFLDITGRKYAEDALKQSEERYRKFFEEDLTGDFIADEDGCILACNSAFAQIFGFKSADSAMYHNLRSIYTEQQTFESIVAMLHEKKKVEYFEVKCRRLDGNAVYTVENVIGLFSESGEFIGIKGYVFDNTAHKSLEMQLQEAQKLESLGRLAGGIAHDFNNLLGIILGYTERLADKREARGAFAKDIAAIYTAAQRGSSLVKQMLTFARKTPVAFEEMNVNTVVEELGKMLKETFPRNITLEFDIDYSIPFINGDTNQIHQALLNLCVNARDAMPNGGNLTIRSSITSGEFLRRRFPEANADSYVCISVADTGVGMSDETRSRIFEPFFSTKERGRGTGLGLAVVHGIVKSHKGIVEVTSEHDNGTTFSLYLPATQVVTQTLPESGTVLQPEIPGGTETLLLVEDEELLLELVQSLLESKGYNIITATDGQAAVEAYKQYVDQIDVVLTDLGLPKLSGWEACQEMLKINPSVKIIVATGYLDPEAKQEMDAHGIHEFVQKPYLASELMAKVREMLDK